MQSFATEVLVSELIPSPLNARLHDEDQVNQICESIKTFGFLNPILIDENKEILAGHGRFMAAVKLALEKIPAVVISGLSEAQKRAYRIADNKIAETSTWDLKAFEREVLFAMQNQINLNAVGLSPSEIREIERLQIQVEKELKGETVEENTSDIIPEPTHPFVLAGDLFMVGDHRLLCDDSTKKEDVERLMNGEKAILMVTDPPYGVDYKPEWRNEALGEANRAIGLVKNDTRVDWTDAYKNFNGDVMYVWHGHNHGGTVHSNIKACGFNVINFIVWAKQHFALSRGDYHWQHEALLYAVRDGAKHNWQGARDQSTLWEINNGLSQGGGTQEEKTGHGTQKPVECMERPIRNNTKSGDLVFDPFLGSGSTLIACEKTNRKCYGMEIDPQYCQVIIDRYMKFTGKNDVYLLKEDGRKIPFDEVKSLRPRG